MPDPLLYRCQSGSMVPLPRFGNVFAASFEEGKIYRLAEVEERSQKSHDHYFAALASAFNNLPERYAGAYQSVEHLRKRALIKCGYADERSIVCANKTEAAKVAAFIRPMDEYAVVLVSECVVTVYTAKSQSRRAMGAKQFQKSKQDVLDLVAALIGVTAEELAANHADAGA